MKSLIFLIVILVAGKNSIAQNNTSGIEGSLNANSPNFLLTNLKNGQLVDLFNPDVYAGVEGSPYFSDEYTYARITLDDNRIFDKVLLKLNLYENKINFKDDKDRERMLAVPVKKIEITDESSKWNNEVFVSSFGEENNAFYRVISTGNKVSLLKKMNVIIKEVKMHNAPNQKKFEMEEWYYILSEGKLFKESKNCSSLIDAFGNDNKVNSFISANDIKCNRERDLKKLVDFYNAE